MTASPPAPRSPLLRWLLPVPTVLFLAIARLWLLHRRARPDNLLER